MGDEAPKAPRGVGCEQRVSSSPLGEGTGGGPEKNSIPDLKQANLGANWMLSVQFTYSWFKCRIS